MRFPILRTHPAVRAKGSQCRSSRNGKRPAVVFAVGAVGLVGTGFLAVIARIIAADVNEPRRWKLAERWPGVPFTSSAGQIPSDLPAATCQTDTDLLVVGPPIGNLWDAAVPSTLRVGDRIVSVAGISTAPVHAETLARFLTATPAGTAIQIQVVRDGPNGRETLIANVELPPAVRDPADLCLDFEQVVLRTTAGQAIHGWYIPPPVEGRCARPALLFVHGRQRNRRHIGLTDLALPAHRRGYGLLLLDLLGNGESDGPIDFWANEEIIKGIRFLARRQEIDRCRIGIVGVSFGGMKALRSAGNPALGAAALAVLSAADMAPCHVRLVAPPLVLPPFIRRRLLRGVTIPRWFVLAVTPPVECVLRWKTGRSLLSASPERSAAQVACPVFLAHGTADRTFSLRAARAIFDAIPTAKIFVPVHGHDHFTAVQSGPALIQTMFAFFGEHIAGSRDTSTHPNDGATLEPGPSWTLPNDATQADVTLNGPTAAD